MRVSKNRKQGQVMFLMVLVSTTLVIFFGMVVAIGQMIHAKINLQNAVDLSAMVGASYQARYLNHIAAANYRIRQNYKWLLFDLYVTQSRFNKDWRQGRFDPSTLAFGICQQVQYYRPMAPGELGDAINDTTDFCQNLEGTGDVGTLIPTLVATPVFSPDPIIISINATILRLKAQFEATCSQFAGQNKAYATYTLGNLKQKNVFQLRQVGNIVNNFVAQMRPTGQATGAMNLTFSNNLVRANAGAQLTPFPAGASFFAPDTGGIDFGTAVTNGGSTGATLRRYFETPSVDVATRYAEFKVENGCQTYVRTAVERGISLGITRSRSGLDPRVPFMVLLQGLSNPRILFWPAAARPTLMAFGAAKPFGSRIAPSIGLTNAEIRTGGGPANMKFTPSDNRGMFRSDILQGAWSSMPAPTSGSNTARPNNGSSAFLEWINAPTKFEAVYYNPFPDNGILTRSFGPLRTEVPNLRYDGDASYQLLDRGSSSVNGWHSVMLKGNSNYASEADLRTSWENRMGYQIKLISMDQALRELAGTSEISDIQNAVGGAGVTKVLH